MAVICILWILIIEVDEQMQTLAVSIGYLIYDLGCCQFEKEVKLDNAIHHIVSIVGLVAGLSYKRVFYFSNVYEYFC